MEGGKNRSKQLMMLIWILSSLLFYMNYPIIQYLWFPLSIMRYIYCQLFMTLFCLQILQYDILAINHTINYTFIYTQIYIHRICRQYRNNPWTRIPYPIQYHPTIPTTLCIPIHHNTHQHSHPSYHYYHAHPPPMHTHLLIGYSSTPTGSHHP